ncbi:PH domain-containing protein [Corynebacterium diphtheriae bv. mitis]|uniref:Membrane protein n=1 Tax=Corynebacterium diphtheriae TaxID=1717 RepID=A0A811FZS8_CORDP|nr:PH domain-containing protein [Corynebacterium diphtheriae]AEX45835.1 putative membrane protein [Corynebacterium diphtheriae INCA 402]OFI58816.1 hypothetical protein BKD85_03735 [Corynebacterium diphtheriae]OFI65299.1 hypothetical protein BKD81_03730 [Corynebacterium diphtheriae]OOG35007.1 hypothetical protein BKD86_0203885 [Corynebacterium diphtheriae]OSQ16529.1 hypothetical protein B1A55_03870 [Corynebacterium diphtheriae]
MSAIEQTALHEQRIDVSSMHRVHRLTPLLQFWHSIFALFVVIALNVDKDEVITVLQHQKYLWWLLGGIVVSFLVVWAISGVWWRSIGYSITDTEVIVAKGVINRSVRSARRDRIQAVDIVESVLARIFRVAEVRIETAGGNDSVLTIGYVSRDRAGKIRRFLIEGEIESTKNDLVVPVERILLATVLTHGVWMAVFIGLWFVPGGAAVAIPMLVGVGPSVWNVIDTGWRFTLRLGQSFGGDLVDEGSADSDSEPTIHVEYGLADRRKQSIPLRRIHAVRMSQPVLWRLCGWWKVTVTVAGYGVGDKKAGTSVLLPVGSKAQAMALVAMLKGVTVDPESPKDVAFSSPRRARWISPIDVSSQVVELLGDIVVVRWGVVSRRVALVQRSHVQELTCVEGPIQRWMRLRTVRLDLVHGPVAMSARDLDCDDASKLLTLMGDRKFNTLNS